MGKEFTVCLHYFNLHIMWCHFPLISNTNFTPQVDYFHITSFLKSFLLHHSNVYLLMALSTFRPCIVTLNTAEHPHNKSSLLITVILLLSYKMNKTYTILLHTERHMSVSRVSSHELKIKRKPVICINV